MTDLWTYRDEIERGRAGSAPEVDKVDLAGFSVEAVDGEDVGKVDQAADEAGKSYLVVDTGPLFLGRKVLVPAGLVRTVDTVAQTIQVDLSKDQLENSPDLEEERLGDESYRTELGRHYETAGS
jgi:hypothetical protein